MRFCHYTIENHIDRIEPTFGYYEMAMLSRLKPTNYLIGAYSMANSDVEEIAMQCPRCQQKVALHINQCPNCKRMLKPLIMRQHIALSTQQRQGLRQNIVTLLVALLFLIDIVVTFHVALKQVSGLIWPIIGLMIAVVGFYLVRLLRDWISGQVLVQIDQLQALQEVRRRGGRRFYGDFRAIGSQQLQQTSLRTCN